MTKKLFRAKVCYDVVVVGEESNNVKAEDDAYFNLSDAMKLVVQNESPEIQIESEISCIETLHIDWYGAIPYGGDGIMTCNEILEQYNVSKRDEIIQNLSVEQKNKILSQMSLEEIANLLGKI